MFSYLKFPGIKFNIQEKKKKKKTQMLEFKPSSKETCLLNHCVSEH